MAELSLQDTTDDVNVTNLDLIWDERCDLKGHILKAGWIFSMPYNYFDGIYGDPRSNQEINPGKDYNLTGMFQEIAQTLAQKCNFTLDMKEIKEFGVKNEDGSWTGIMELLRKKELDVAIADITPTYQRSDIADFSIGLRRSDYLLFQATSKNHFNWELYKNVFSDHFWICLIICIFTLTACLFLVRLCTMGK